MSKLSRAEEVERLLTTLEVDRAEFEAEMIQLNGATFKEPLSKVDITRTKRLLSDAIVALANTISAYNIELKKLTTNTRSFKSERADGKYY